MKAINILNFILKFWGYIPILSLSDDNDYPDIHLSVDKENNKNICPRFSFINIMFGAVCIRIISFAFKPLHFDLIKVNSMSELKQFNLSDKEIKSKLDKYKKHYKKLNKKAKYIEKESLIRHLNDEKDRISISLSKVNMFSSFVLMILALVPITNLSKYLDYGLQVKIILIFEIYVLLNLLFLVMQTFEVKNHCMSKFSDLKNSSNKQKDTEYCVQIYYDWQQNIKKAELFVSYVLQFQEWIKIGIIISIMLAILIFI